MRASLKLLFSILCCLNVQIQAQDPNKCDYFTFSECDIESNLILENEEVHVNNLRSNYFISIFRLKVMTCVKHRVHQLHLAISFYLIMMVFANFTGEELLIFAISSTFSVF